MKFLVAVALLALAVAEATHVAKHTLREPRFKEGFLYKYNLDINVTSGILGLSSQVSAAVLQAEVNIYAVTDQEHILKIRNIRVSDSVAAIEHKYGYIDLKTGDQIEDKKFEDRLMSTIKFKLENGRITSYTLSKKDNLRTQKIKKSILRSLEMEVTEDAMKRLEEQPGRPVSYNRTLDTEFGVHTKSWTITVIPFSEFPAEKSVYNISRIDNFEGEWYPSHETEYNFQKQGCSEVCRKAGEWHGNEFAAGCPIGHEPHQSPIKKSFNHEHTLSPVEGTGGTLALDTITTVEVHFAKMYDQDMEVLFRYHLHRFDVTSEEKLDLESNQITNVPELDDWDSEINEQEIDDLCDYRGVDEAVKASKELLSSIASLIVNGEVDAPVGEKAMLLRDALARLTLEGFMRVAENITKLDNLAFRSDEEKVKRQIWMDVLPVVGTHESVKFIVKYITEQLAKEKANILVWEAKEILEALPQNIKEPNAATITELKKLIDNENLLKRRHLLHSAAHLSLARVIGEACGNIPVLRSKEQKKSFWFSSFQRAAAHGSRRGKGVCPEEVMEIIENIKRKLEKTDLPEEIAVYIETLTHTGIKDAVKAVSDYVYGTARNVQPLTQRFIDFIKSIAIHALHNIAGKYPEDVLEVVLPVFFNETESHKIRNAAFGIIIRCQPPLDVLEKIAIRSWFEKSYEVGSFVTSTLETFGNSSLPCMQLVAHRIKTVLPHVKRFDVGMQHAKNYMWSYFDELREFGLESRLEYTPNNESFIPTTLYTSLSYSMDSLRDVIFQNSLNVEGFTHKKVWEQLIKYLNIESVEPIEKEDEIFGSYKKGMYYLHPRDVDDLRMTSFHRLFYRSSFYFLDKHSRRQAWIQFSELFKTYLKKRETEYTGYIVKLFLPSYYHTISIARTLPYPVEFQMRQPVVFAVKIQTPDNAILPVSDKYFNLQFKPSLYLSKLYTHQMKNIGDCKEVGVYHEHKVAMTYPFELKYNGLIFPNITLKYKVPAEHKKILYYVSESGTYAGKKELQKLPTTGSKRPIRTRATPFKMARDHHFVGIPSVHIDVHTEDTNLFTQRLPRNPTEALHIAVQRILNAGWRYKSVNISISKDQVGWKSDNEGTFSVRYSRKHVPSTNEGILTTDWSKWLIPLEVRSVKSFAEIAIKTSKVLNVLLPHVNHFWNISLKAEPLTNIANLKLEFNHTYEKDLFAVHAEAVSEKSQRDGRYEFTLDHLMGYWNRPDELQYDKNYGKQSAGFLTAIKFPSPNKPPCSCQPWEKIEVALFGHLNYESNKKILEEELLSPVEDKDFLPATHEKCVSDIRDGNPLSEDCVKAIREYSLFNKVRLQILWDKDLLHKNVSHYARVLDVYLKHYFFEYMTLSSERNEQNQIHVKMDYIDKFVDEPVVDVRIRRPTETLNLRRVPVGPFQPLSSVYSMYETSLLEATNNTYPPSCVWSKNYVQTFDKVTYEFTPKDCQYVLSTHCTRSKNFAVVIKGTKEIHIHVATSLVVLYPESVRKPYRVRFDDKDFELDEPHLFHPRHDFYAYTEKIGGHIHIHVVATETGIHLVYDGENVKFQVSPRYKGELCGLCSEFDGETLREMRGIDRCLYTDPADFAQSAMIQREGKCTAKHWLGERYCDYDVNKNWKSPTPAFREGSEPREPTLKRNLVFYKGNDVCFSVQPVAGCEDEDEPTDTEKQRVGFHCLPSSDLTAKKMVTEAKFRTLEEIEKKSVDHVQNVDIPKMC